MPPLRERPEDVAPVGQQIWTAASARVNIAATLSHGGSGAGSVSLAGERP